MAWVLAMPRLSAALRLAAVAAVLAYGIPRSPEFCSAAQSVRAIAPLVRGEDPVEVPPGSAPHFYHPGQPGNYIRWDDYRRTSLRSARRGERTAGAGLHGPVRRR